MAIVCVRSWRASVRVCGASKPIVKEALERRASRIVQLSLSFLCGKSTVVAISEADTARHDVSFVRPSTVYCLTDVSDDV